jgi:hypothetical protein
MAKRKAKQLLAGMQCRRCGKEISTGLVFLCGPRSWIPFCSKCLYQSKNRMAVAIAATGLSDAELADHMLLSRHTIGAWRRGRVKRPKKANMEKLASLAGVSVEWLKGEDDRPT